MQQTYKQLYVLVKGLQGQTGCNCKGQIILC